MGRDDLLSRRELVRLGLRAALAAAVATPVLTRRTTAAPIEESAEFGYGGYRRCWWRNGRRYCRIVYRAADGEVLDG